MWKARDLRDWKFLLEWTVDRDECIHRRLITSEMRLMCENGKNLNFFANNGDVKTMVFVLSVVLIIRISVQQLGQFRFG